MTAYSFPSHWIPRRIRPQKPHWRASTVGAILSCGSAFAMLATSARSSSAGRWPPPWRVRAGIDPFDQPDVESAKVAARKLTDAYEREGSLPSEKPFFQDARFQLFAAPDHARRVLHGNAAPELGSLVRAHLATAGAGDYIGLLAFVRRDAQTVAGLRRIRGKRSRVEEERDLRRVRPAIPALHRTVAQGRA